MKLITFDDGQLNNGEANISGISLNLNRPGDRIVLRFVLVPAAPGGRATAARLQLFLPQPLMTTIRARIYCEAADSAAPLALDNFDRPLTDRYVEWSADGGAAGWVESPDFSEVVNEVLVRTGWRGQNALAVVLVATAAANLRARSLNGATAGEEPLLVLELDAATEPEPPTPIDLSRQMSVIVRDIPPGGSHEVRHVRPVDIVMTGRDIDWTQTPFTAYILTGEPDETAD